MYIRWEIFMECCFLSDKIDLSVLGCVCICILVIVLVYIKNAIAFVRERKFLRLIFLSILVLGLCFLFIITCYNFYK